MLRSYAGGVKGVVLTAPVTDIATSATVSTLAGVPDGSNGPFAVVIGKGTPNEEKVLVSTASGGVMTFNQRGYDGTIALPHADGEEVRLVITSIDASEANAHVNATLGVHGLGITDSVVGTGTAQELTNKTLSGLNNTISNIDLELSPELVAAFGAETAARLAGDGLRYTKAEADSLFPTFAAVAASDVASMLAHTSAVDPHIQYLTKVQAGTDYLPLVNGGLAPADVPEAHTGRVWTAPLDAVTVTDGDPQENMAFIVIPAATGPGQAGGSGDRLFLVTASIKGFTTSGADNDVARFSAAMLESTNGTWLGLAGDGITNYPQINRRMSGNVGTGAEGCVLSGVLRVPFGLPSTVVLFLNKISGVNVTNLSGDGYLTAVQLV